LEDSRDQLEKGAFPGAVFPDNAESLAALDLKVEIAQGPEVVVEAPAVQEEKFFETMAGSVVDGIALGDSLKSNNTHSFGREGKVTAVRASSTQNTIGHPRAAN
jgi:hypothetical protein